MIRVRPDTMGYFGVTVFLSLALSAAAFAQTISGSATSMTPRVPVIDVTDLYDPHDDAGDNFDIVTAYALPEIDLRAVILDVSDRVRNRGKEPGIIPIEQMNYIFNRNVPFGLGPFSRMRSLDDKMLDAPAFQQQGIELLLKTLRESSVPITIVSFGSLRPIAVAYNRDPALFHAKVAAIHICAGIAYSSLSHVAEVVEERGQRPGFNREWNVSLDPVALVRILRTDLPIAIYPCAGPQGADVLDPHDSFWRLPNSHFIEAMEPRVRKYLEFQYGQPPRRDFLRAMDGMTAEEEAQADRVFNGVHDVWETAVWMGVSGRLLVQHQDKSYEIVPANSVKPADVRLKNDLVPCKMEVRDDANFVCTPTSDPSNFRAYDRGDPNLSQTALQEALPKLYRSFRTP